jgi:hypothetical protein
MPPNGQQSASYPVRNTKMKRFLILSALVLSTTLIGPVTARAGAPTEKRYYDKSGKDYHTWNSNEDRAYRSYVTEQHQQYRDFNKVNRNQQQQYFTRGAINTPTIRSSKS